MSSKSAINNHSSDSDSEVLVKVENVGKVFCRDFKKSLLYGLKDSVKDLVGGSRRSSTLTERSLREGEFWANKGVSFELRRGECLGLIGHNGAGKTTLLKMLNGLIKPDTGKIEMHGRVGALIALGAGFNPILSGRENIYINGSVLGLSRKEIDEKLDEIIDFAEIREFIDSPVQTYSSGMQVRLGFAIAVILIQPDILILDEVLAVGDISFTIKCLNAVRKLTEHSAVIFVSHNVQFISQFCSNILLLETGQMKMLSRNVSEGIEAYLGGCDQQEMLMGTQEVSMNREVLSSSVRDKISEPRIVEPDEELIVNMTLDVSNTAQPAEVMIILKDNSARGVVTYIATDEAGNQARLTAGKHDYRFELGNLGLTPGRYYFVVSISSQEPERICLRREGFLPFVVASKKERSHLWTPLTRSARTTISRI